MLLGPLLVLGVGLLLLYRSVAVEVDARLAGLYDRVAPRVYARPFVLRNGQSLTAQELDDRLDDLGYTRKERATQSGEFDIRPAEVRLVPRGGTAEGQVVRVGLTIDASGRSGRVASLSVQQRGVVPEVQLEAPLLTAVAPGGRGRQRQLPLAQLPPAVRDVDLCVRHHRQFRPHARHRLTKGRGVLVDRLQQHETPHFRGDDD